MIKSLLQCLRRGLAIFGVYRGRRVARQRRGAGDLTILMYHRVGCASPGNSRLSVRVARFDAQLEFLRRHYDILDMDTAVDLLRAGRPPTRNSVIITFDDGYADIVDHALPILIKHKAPALVYAVAGYAGTQKMFWWDRVGLAVHASTGSAEDALSSKAWYRGKTREQLQSLHRGGSTLRTIEALCRELDGLGIDDRDTMLDEWEEAVASRIDPTSMSQHLTADWDQLRELKSSSVLIGCHTMNHAKLTTLAPTQARQEIDEARKMIESRLDMRVRHFAYPYGQADYVTSEVPALVREAGFDSACLAIPGACRGSDLFTLLRVYVGDHDTRDLEIQIERQRSPISRVDPISCK